MQKYLNETQTLIEAERKLSKIISYQNQIQPYYTEDMLSNIEIWEPVIYKNIKLNMYEVSNYGRVRNIHTGKILSQFSDKGRYLYIGVQTCDNERRTITIHRLVATAFIPKTEEDLLLGRDTVNHINLFPNDNRYINLEWVTNEENLAYSRFMYESVLPYELVTPIYNSTNTNNWSNGFITSGENNGMCTIPDETIHIICKCREQGMSYKECAEVAGIEYNEKVGMYISSICRGIKRKDISSKYNISKNYSKTQYSEDEIRKVCCLIRDGYNNTDISRIMNFDNTKKTSNKNIIEWIRRIRTKQCYKEISDQYF